MDAILSQLNLGTFTERFRDERVDPDVVLSKSDSALAGLGVSTIGDRVRLRDLCTKYVTQRDEGEGNAVATGSDLSYRDSVSHERSLLFQPSGSGRRGTTGSSGRGKKRKNSCPRRTWTVQFV